LAFEVCKAFCAACGVGIDAQARTAAFQHLGVKPELRAEIVNRLNLGERTVITVTRQAAIIELHFTAEHHVFEQALAFFMAVFAVAFARRRGGRFDASEAHALTGVQHERIAIKYFDNAAALARLQIGEGAFGLACGERGEHEARQYVCP
jgi:hypothetical protein